MQSPDLKKYFMKTVAEGVYNCNMELMGKNKNI